MTNQREDLKHLDVNDWIRWWEDGPIWHEVNVNPILEKYISLLDGGKKNLKIFVPLCGKTLDLKWLFDQGHRVVGVDCCQFALEDFFKDHSMEYTVETQNGIPVFSENSGRIVLYSCNIFDLHKTGEGSFDAVWDRGGFEVINSRERTRYADLLTSLKTPNAPHLLELFEFDDRLYRKPPFNIPMSNVLEYWGDRYDIKLIETREAPEIVQRIKADFKSLKKNYFLLTFK